MQRRQTDRSDLTARDPRARRALLAMAVVHPAPSILDSVLVAILALIAGGEPSVAGVLAVAMLGFQGDTGDPDGDHPRPLVGHADVGGCPLKPLGHRGARRDRHDRARRRALVA